MMGGCGTPVPFYSWHCSCANLYTLQSRSRSLINNKSTRAQKSPESAERAGTKKSLHIWRCVMSSRGAFKAAFHQTHLMSRTNNTACQGRRALACAYCNAAQNRLCTRVACVVLCSPTAEVARVFWASLNASWKLLRFPWQKTRRTVQQRVAHWVPVATKAANNDFAPSEEYLKVRQAVLKGRELITLADLQRFEKFLICFDNETRQSSNPAKPSPINISVRGTFSYLPQCVSDSFHIF